MFAAINAASPGAGAGAGGAVGVEPALSTHVLLAGGETLEAASARAAAAHQAALRAAEGYMAKWSREDDGTYLLVENHCPICAAAAACQGFCRAELALFRTALGECVTVERTDHILAGARRCAYRISPPAA